jgi:hypothetical protein
MLWRAVTHSFIGTTVFVGGGRDHAWGGEGVAEVRQEVLCQRLAAASSVNQLRVHSAAMSALCFLNNLVQQMHSCLHMPQGNNNLP